MAIPVTLQAGGEALVGKTATVSKFGALVVLRAPQPTLGCGDPVAVAIQRARQSRTGRVVWIDRRNAAYCAIEIEQPRDFWGVYFPGSAEDPVVLPEPVLEAASAGPGQTPAVSRAPLSLPGAQIVPIVGATTLFEPDHEFAAQLSGISAIYNSFTEHMVLVPGAPGELTGMLATPLMPGTRVRVMVNSRLLYGRVLAVSGRRVEGKARVRLKVLEAGDPQAG